MEHPYFQKGERPVFDNTPFGIGLQAEEQGEPGITLEGYGMSALLEEDLHGDWSYKPNRNKRYGIGEDMPTLRSVPQGAAELYRREAFPRS